jgi:hypothetical protein
VRRLLWLFAVGLGGVVGATAQMPPSEASAPASAPITKPAARPFRQVHRGPALDDQVKKLTRELRLDANQQAMVRIILQHREAEVVKALEEGSLSAVDRFAALNKLHEMSDNQIGRILNADQAIKFDQVRHRAKPEGQPKPDEQSKP